VKEQVILVNEADEPQGLMEKMEAHEKGLLHRAFSVFVFNEKNELLLQQRAKSKYHSGGLWTNTCCSHPRHGEKNLDAAHRRLMEEMGFDCDLEKLTDFVYRAELDHGLTEHEFDHVFVGRWQGVPDINTDEVESYKWMDVEAVERDIAENPDRYTEWFKIIYHKFLKHVRHASNG
jgi:isopentenyl-diphosphate delta-isomerase